MLLKEVLTLETRLDEILWDEEKVRWSGRPKPFQLMEATVKQSFILTWVTSILILLAVVATLAPALASGSRSVSDVLIMSTIVLFLPVILSVRPFLDKQCQEKQTIYAITNFRIIAIIKDEVMYLSINKGMQVSVDSQADGCGHLRFGDVVGQPARKNRVHAILGLRSGSTKSDMMGLMFYHVDRPERVLAYLS